jgi:histidine triad (HIT) family protein
MCLFCQIIERKIAAKIVFEDDLALAFEDIRPQAPTHLLIIPKKHIHSLETLEDEDDGIIGHLFQIARDLARKRGIERSGYRTVINTGPQAGQSVFHVHVHLLGGRSLSWPPG